MTKPARNSDRFDPTAPKPFTITVSSRALLDLEESHEIFEKMGSKAFAEYQRKNENKPLKPGPAFSLIKKMIDMNAHIPPGGRLFEVILLSRNSPETGLRVFNTLEKMGLKISRAVFTSGTPVSKYIKAIDADLFLSSNPVEVKKVIDLGIAAATLMQSPVAKPADSDEKIRIAFDGDAVLFGDDSERVHHEGGLEAFQAHEQQNAHIPLAPGPLRTFLEVIHDLQQHFPDDCPIRTALVTARSTPAHKRAILTLRHWGVRVDEAMFLGGMNKGPYLEAFGPDIFFDDSLRNIENAMSSKIPSGHVPYGVRNAPGSDESNFTGGAVPKP